MGLAYAPIHLFTLLVIRKRMEQASTGGRSLTIYILCVGLYALVNCLIYVVQMLTLNKSLKRENFTKQITEKIFLLA